MGSGVARAVQEKLIKPSKPKDRAMISYSGEPLDCKLNDKVEIMIKGKVTALRQDEYGKSIDIEISSMEKEYEGK